MDAVESFLAEVMPVQEKAERALHDGVVGPRIALWTRVDPVTVFGAAVPVSQGWEEVQSTFDWIAARFGHCTAYEFELIAAGASGDLAYAVGFEHTTCEIDGVPTTYTLRATHVYRRERGAWRTVHRHGDAPPTDPRGGASTLQAEVTPGAKRA